MCDHCCVYVGPPTVVDCGLLDPPQRGRVFLSGTTFGSRANYSCETNHKLVGPVRRVCLESGIWSNTSPTCEGMHIAHSPSAAVQVNLRTRALKRQSHNYVLVERSELLWRPFNDYDLSFICLIL